jgi:hypothetical protein
MSDSTDHSSQLAAKDAEVQVLREKVNKLSEERDKFEKAFHFIMKKYENLLNQLGATDA